MSTLELAAEVAGTGDTLIVLHGLFGSSRNWRTVAKRLSSLRRVHCLDLRNHGSSPWSGDMRYESMAGDVAAYIERRGIGPVDLLGHSMGGKTAMCLALTRPDLVRRLIVVDIAPRLYRKTDYPSFVAAMKAAHLDPGMRREEIADQLAPAVPDAGLRAFLSQNLVREKDGFRWRINLDGIAANLPAIVSWSGIMASFDAPAAFIKGGLSEYIRPDDEPAIRALFPAAAIVRIEGAGHWPHAERTEEFVTLARNALA